MLDDDWGDVEADIVLDGRFPEVAFLGLDQFSHIEVIFHFHRLDPDRIHTGARHPRNRPEWPEMGIFAQRAMSRPNRLGLTICELLAVDGRRLRVRGLDAVDGTPVLDIKPVIEEFLPRGPLRQPAWTRGSCAATGRADPTSVRAPSPANSVPARPHAGVQGRSSRREPTLRAPGRIRTCDARFRKPMLYPLSYEGGTSAFEETKPFADPAR